MSSLTQYLNLWRDHKDLVEANASAPLNALRPAAFDALKGMETHGERLNETISKVLAPDYGLNIARMPMDGDPAASFRCDLPRLAAHPLYILNDSFLGENISSSENIDSLTHSGVEAMSLAEAARRYPEYVTAHYGRLADFENPVVALDTLLCQDGLFLRIPKGVRLEKPLQLINVLNSLVPFMAVRRLLIVVEEEAEGELLVCDHTQVRDVELCSLEVVEIFAAKNSRFEYYSLEESTEKTGRLSALYLRQEAGSRVLIDGVTLYNGVTRNEYYCRYAGQGASLRLLGMAIEDGDRRAENSSRIEHDVEGCHTDELFKYVIDDRAVGSFEGRITVAPGADRTEAFQSNRNLVGSNEARMFSKPELVINADDVKCSHGSATGQLDELQLFYMRTRGLSEEEARLLLKQAFMADVIDAVGLPLLRDRLRHLVEVRFAGGCASCSSCLS